MIANIDSPEIKSRANFPKLMYSGKMVVLFETAGKGTVVSEECGGRCIGYHSNSWTMSNFTDCQAEHVITLVNVMEKAHAN